VNEVRISVRVRPGGRKDELRGFHDGVLIARVSAPPVDGRANRALCRLVARRAGVPASHVEIVRGHRSREKVLSIVGLGTDDVERALGRP
jgi:uncharacterized protein (TIGR00251 family)